MKKASNFIFLHLDIQLSQYHLLKRKDLLFKTKWNTILSQHAFPGGRKRLYSQKLTYLYHCGEPIPSFYHWQTAAEITNYCAFLLGKFKNILSKSGEVHENVSWKPHLSCVGQWNKCYNKSRPKSVGPGQGKGAERKRCIWTKKPSDSPYKGTWWRRDRSSAFQTWLTSK